MRLATWNVQRVPSAPQRRRILASMALVDSDVWVLTETDTALLPDPGFSATFSGKPDRTGEPGERWVGIASRFPIDPLPPMSDPVRSAAALVRPPGRAPLVVCGTVLPWTSDRWRGIRGVAGFLAALAPQREDWVRLRAEHSDAELIVAGDFNQDLSDRHYYWSRERRSALRTALEAAGLVALTGGSGDPVREVSKGARASIDHICVPADSSWTRAPVSVWPRDEAPDRRLSDHYGVVVELK